MTAGTADDTGRDEMRVPHKTQNSHRSNSMCPSIKSRIRKSANRFSLETACIFVLSTRFFGRTLRL